MFVCKDRNKKLKKSVGQQYFTCFYSLMRMSAFARIAVSPPIVMPLENMLCITSGILSNMFGTSSTLSPIAKLIAMTRTALRLMAVAAMMRMPAAATVPNISSVAPPSTQSGISEKNCPTTGNKPKTSRAPATK